MTSTGANNSIAEPPEYISLIHIVWKIHKIVVEIASRLTQTNAKQTLPARDGEASPCR
jgi:hypothetical protein